VEITQDIERKLRLFARLLAEANNRVRLTGPFLESVIYCEHIKDAVEASSALDPLPPGSRFADIGTGGGIPGIVWCVLRPDVEGVLADSAGKKIKIVGEMIAALDLKNATAVNARSEEIALRQREAFNLAAARAVADSRVSAEYLSPLVRIGGLLAVFKGSKVREEIGIPAERWKKLGLAPPSLTPYSSSGKELYLLVWEKITSCPARFPRKPGEAKRSPWWVK
jgi:16S rRNA (guanine527-N7)-methyltransferase